MKLTESTLKQIIQEEIEKYTIDDKLFNGGDNFILSQLNKNSQFEWKISDQQGGKDAARSPRHGNKGMQIFDAHFDDETIYRVAIYGDELAQQKDYSVYIGIIHLDVIETSPMRALWSDPETYNDMSEMVFKCLRNIDKKLKEVVFKFK